MYTIIDYVHWFRYIPFNEKKFQALDAVVLSNFSYLKMDDVADGSKNLRTCVHELKLRSPLQQMIKMPFVEDSSVEFMEAVSASERYGHLLIRDYVDIYNEKENVQFCALTFFDPDFSYICFRGTDDTLIGWKEDFMMSFTKIKAQELAHSYLQEHIQKDRIYYVGGHSKGGHLALYGCAMLSEDLWEQVNILYLLDSPGLCPEVLDLSLLERTDQKAVSITPEYSIFGQLFARGTHEQYIIKSKDIALAQHALSGWAVRYGQPDCSDKHDEGCIWVNEALDQWLEQTDVSQRKRVVEEIFSALSSQNAVSIYDIYAKGPFAFEQVISELFSISRESKEAVGDLSKKALDGKRKRPINYKDFVKLIRFSRPVQTFLRIFMLALIWILPPSREIFFLYALIVTFLIVMFQKLSI